MLNNKYFNSLTSVIIFASTLITPFKSHAQTYPEYVYVDANGYMDDEENIPVKKSNTGFFWFLGAAAVGIGAGVGIATSNSGGRKHHHKKEVVTAANLTAPQSTAPQTLVSTNVPSVAINPQPVIPVAQTLKIENPVVSKPEIPSTLLTPLTISTSSTSPIPSTPSTVVSTTPEPVIPVNTPEPTKNDIVTNNQGRGPSKPIANKGHSLIFDFTLNTSSTLGGGIIAYVEIPGGKILTAAPFSLFSLNRTIVVPDPVYGSYRYGVVVSPSLVSISASLSASISSDIPGRGTHQTLPLTLGMVTSETQMDQEFTYELDTLR